MYQSLKTLTKHLHVLISSLQLLHRVKPFTEIHWRFAFVLFFVNIHIPLSFFALYVVWRVPKLTKAMNFSTFSLIKDRVFWGGLFGSLCATLVTIPFLSYEDWFCLCLKCHPTYLDTAWFIVCYNPKKYFSFALCVSWAIWDLQCSLKQKYDTLGNSLGLFSPSHDLACKQLPALCTQLPVNSRSKCQTIIYNKNNKTHQTLHEQKIQIVSALLRIATIWWI